MRRKLEILLTTGLLALVGTWCGAQQGTDSDQRAFAEHAQKAQQYLREKRPDLAIPELAAAVAVAPDNVEAQANLGVLLYFQGKLGEAIPHLRIAVEHQPDLVKIQGVLGIAELRTQDFELGRKDLEAAFPSIQEEKFKVQVGLELVSFYTQTGDLEQAAPILAQLRKASPENAEVLYAAYRTYSDLAGEAMLSLGMHAANSAQMHQMMAHEENRQGKTNEAVAEYHKAIAIDPHLPGIHFELAELLHTSQDALVKKEAQQEYEAALKEDPQDERLLRRLAELAAERGDTEAAYAGFTQAVKLQPADADAKLGLAKALMDMDKPDQALPILEETVQQEPSNAVAPFRLGTLYRKLGRVEDAKREIEIYKQLREAKEKLRAQYKDLLIVPSQIRVDEPQ